MNVGDNYLEVNDSPNDRLYETVYKQIVSSDKWSKPVTQQMIDESKVSAFCLKTKDVKTKQKIFVNFCHSPQMKAPTLDLNEEELRSLLASEEADSFTIPLLLTQMKKTIDKSGSEAMVLDAIINTDLYTNKVVSSELYRTFLVTVTLETIERDKYKGSIEKSDWILLKNKKYQEVIDDASGDKTMVNELSAKLNIYDINNDINASNGGFDYEYSTTIQNMATKVREANEELKTGFVISQETETNDSSKQKNDISADSTEEAILRPKYKLKLNVGDNCLNGQIVLPLVNDINQINLSLGEDRILLNAFNYKLDIFVPVLIDYVQAVSAFDALTHVLDVKMPLI